MCKYMSTLAHSGIFQILTPVIANIPPDWNNPWLLAYNRCSINVLILFFLLFNKKFWVFNMSLVLCFSWWEMIILILRKVKGKQLLCKGSRVNFHCFAIVLQVSAIHPWIDRKSKWNKILRFFITLYFSWDVCLIRCHSNTKWANPEKEKQYVKIPNQRRTRVMLASAQLSAVGWQWKATSKQRQDLTSKSDSTDSSGPHSPYFSECLFSCHSKWGE